MGGVTVVIPFWDLDLNILKDCVRSVQAQSEQTEILVVDNCSNPPVPEIRGTRVHRLEERVSVGKARNAGLDVINTPYVMFMDADDKLLPGAVAHLRRLLEKDSTASLAAGRIIDWIPETGDKREKPWPSNFAHWANKVSHRLFRTVNAARNMTPVTGCAVMRTEMAQATRGFPDTTAEDWTFGVSMSFQGRIMLSEREVKLYRWRAEGLSKQAVRDIKALFEARHATRRAIRTEAASPQWMKSVLPLVALLHTLELPFHILRERAFSNATKISASRPLVVKPTTVAPSLSRRPIPTAARLGIPTGQIAAAVTGVPVSLTAAPASGGATAAAFSRSIDVGVSAKPLLKLKKGGLKPI